MAAATPASAQSRPTVRSTDAPGVSLRPFVVIAEQSFSARETFETVFGHSFQPLWGGGLNVALRNGFYADVTAVRFKKTGQRAFFFEGQGYGLQIPLTGSGSRRGSFRTSAPASGRTTIRRYPRSTTRRSTSGMSATWSSVEWKFAPVAGLP